MAQKTFTLVPDLSQYLLDDTAGTLSLQVWNTTNLAWDTVYTVNLANSSEAMTFAKQATLSAGLTGTGSTGALTAGVGILGAANTFTAAQAFAAITATTGGFSGLLTASGGLTGTGNTGTLGAGTGILGAANTWTAEQTLAALLASAGSPYGAGIIPSVLGATTAQKIQSGTGSTAVATAGTAVTTAVTFATAFVSAPLVVLGQTSASGGTAGYIVTLAGSVTATGFTVTANSYLAQTIGWSWVAIGN